MDQDSTSLVAQTKTGVHAPRAVVECVGNLTLRDEGRSRSGGTAPLPSICLRVEQSLRLTPCTFPQCGPNRALVSLTDRADSPGATYCPLCPNLFGEHLGGTSALTSCRELRSSRKTAPGAPVQGKTEIAAVRN